MDIPGSLEDGQLGPLEWLISPGDKDFFDDGSEAMYDQHHPLEGGLGYMLLPVAAGLGACGYVAKVFAQRRLAARRHMGFKGLSDDDLSVCSSSVPSDFDDAWSYLTARTAASSSHESACEQHEELCSLLSTYHLDNSSSLSYAFALHRTASSQSSLSTSSSSSSLVALGSPSGSMLSSCSDPSGLKHDHTVPMPTLAKNAVVCTSTASRSQLVRRQRTPGSEIRRRGVGGLAPGSALHSRTQSMDSLVDTLVTRGTAAGTATHDFCGKLYIVGTLQAGESITAAAEDSSPATRCRFRWHRLTRSEGRLKALRIPNASSPYYTITAADVGCSLRVTAYAFNVEGMLRQGKISAVSRTVQPAGARETHAPPASAMRDTIPTAMVVNPPSLKIDIPTSPGSGVPSPPHTTQAIVGFKPQPLSKSPSSLQPTAAASALHSPGSSTGSHSSNPQEMLVDQPPTRGSIRARNTGTNVKRKLEGAWVGDGGGGAGARGAAEDGPAGVRAEEESRSTSDALHGLHIAGELRCASQVVAKGKGPTNSTKCRFQWTRLQLDQENQGNLLKTRIKGANAPWYTPTQADVGCWLRVKAAAVLEDGTSGPASIATTSGCVAPLSLPSQ